MWNKIKDPIICLIIIEPSFLTLNLYTVDIEIQFVWSFILKYFCLHTFVLLYLGRIFYSLVNVWRFRGITYSFHYGWLWCLFFHYLCFVSFWFLLELLYIFLVFQEHCVFGQWKGLISILCFTVVYNATLFHYISIAWFPYSLFVYSLFICIWK